MTEQRPHRRLFFSLWPSPEIRAGIVDRRELIEGLSRKKVPDHNLHLTLLFLGDQPADELDRIIAAAKALDWAGFRLTLDRLGWFARARVAWLGGPPTAAGQGLVDQLKAKMTLPGLRFEDRPWAPHVTLFRKVHTRPAFPDVEPLVWPIEQFELIESVPGRPYESLATFKLA